MSGSNVCEINYSNILEVLPVVQPEKMQPRQCQNDPDFTKKV